MQIGRAAKAKIRRAAKWLDREKPGWPRKVRIRELDMASTAFCVLGQAFEDEADWDDDGWRVAIERVPEELQEAFHGTADEEVWKDEIRKRRRTRR